MVECAEKYLVFWDDHRILPVRSTGRARVIFTNNRVNTALGIAQIIGLGDSLYVCRLIVVAPTIKPSPLQLNSKSSDLWSAT